MRIARLGYAEGPNLKATSAGRQSLIRWISNEPSDPIEMRVIDDANKSTELPDFPKPSTGSVALSARAYECVGSAAFEMTSKLDIKGADGYLLGWPWETDTYLEMEGDEYIEPLRLKTGVKPPHGLFMRPAVPFSGLMGYFFVTQETWEKIESAGLTGLIKVGEYEVIEP